MKTQLFTDCFWINVTCLGTSFIAATNADTHNAVSCFCSLQAYDCCLTAALHAQQRGRSQLRMTDDWGWLLNEFAVAYGVRSTYACLAFLGWVVRSVHGNKPWTKVMQKVELVLRLALPHLSKLLHMHFMSSSIQKCQHNMQTCCIH